MTVFENVEKLPEDPILSIPALFHADAHPKKVNLGIGAYRTSEGRPLILTAVKKAEASLVESCTSKDYAPIEGVPEYAEESLKVILGKSFFDKYREHFYSAQTIGGTGAIRILSEFIAKELKKPVFLSTPTWINHDLLLTRAGIIHQSYPYYNDKEHSLNFSGMCEAIERMPQGSIILLQAVCHNPTGQDPTKEQWIELSQLIRKQKLLPFFDIAYQGFGEDFESDVFPVRYFIEQGHEMLIAYSFSKNLGLYGERIGLLTIVTQNPKKIPNIGSQIRYLIRGAYSTPPIHGALVVKTVLKSETLKKEWLDELSNICFRIKEMRKTFVAALYAKNAQQNYNYLLKQTGMFSYCGLKEEQTNFLRKEKGIYLPLDGRINFAGLNTNNIEYVAESLVSALSVV